MRPKNTCTHCSKEHYGWFSLCMDCLYIQEYGQLTKPKPTGEKQNGYKGTNKAR